MYLKVNIVLVIIELGSYYKKLFHMGITFFPVNLNVSLLIFFTL